MQLLQQCLFFIFSKTFLLKCLSETKPPLNKNHKTPPLSATQLVANFSSPQVRAPIVSQPVYTVANNFPVYRILPQVDCLKTDQNQVCSQTLKSRRSLFSRSVDPTHPLSIGSQLLQVVCTSKSSKTKRTGTISQNQCSFHILS